MGSYATHWDIKPTGDLQGVLNVLEQVVGLQLIQPVTHPYSGMFMLHDLYVVCTTCHLKDVQSTGEIQRVPGWGTCSAGKMTANRQLS